jgi:hypothetical protein
VVAPSDEGTNIPNLIGLGQLALTTSAEVDTAKEAVKTVKKASPTMKKGSLDVADETKEDKKVSKSVSTSNPSEL